MRFRLAECLLVRGVHCSKKSMKLKGTEIVGYGTTEAEWREAYIYLAAHMASRLATVPPLGRWPQEAGRAVVWWLSSSYTW